MILLSKRSMFDWCHRISIVMPYLHLKVASQTCAATDTCRDLSGLPTSQTHIVYQGFCPSVPPTKGLLTFESSLAMIICACVELSAPAAPSPWNLRAVANHPLHGNPLHSRGHSRFRTRRIDVHMGLQAFNLTNLYCPGWHGRYYYHSSSTWRGMQTLRPR